MYVNSVCTLEICRSGDRPIRIQCADLDWHCHIFYISAALILRVICAIDIREFSHSVKIRILILGRLNSGLIFHLFHKARNTYAKARLLSSCTTKYVNAYFCAYLRIFASRSAEFALRRCRKRCHHAANIFALHICSST